MGKIFVEDADQEPRPFLYVIANKGLHMSAGKLAAQVGHAVALSMAAQSSYKLDMWQDSIHRTLIVLEAENNEQLANIVDYLRYRDFKTHIVVDEGVNEITPFSVTAVASDVLDKNDYRVGLAFGSFPLYTDKIKIKLEFDR